MIEKEKTRIISSALIPTIIVILMWAVKLTEITFHFDFAPLGIMPMKALGLIGIITSPFIHGDMAHLMANTIPMWVLGIMLFYFYRQIAWKVLLLIALITGFWVWVWAREAYHVGASGVIYGLASFLFFSGIFRKDTKLMAISMIITFLYGGLIWGLFPELYPKKNISWESHLMGLLSGFVLAIFFRKDGPQRRKWSWELEEESDDEDDEDAYWNKPLQQKKPKHSPLKVDFTYKQKDNTQDNQENNNYHMGNEAFAVVSLAVMKDL